MKRSTKAIFLSAITLTTVSCFPVYYGPYVDIVSGDDYIEQIAHEESQIVTTDKNDIKEQK
ncbi:MAG: hypothetical protein IKP67_01550 [Spirochaetales bacterium]|nr:hypothetical protein [Spirochaetales bacterium]